MPPGSDQESPFAWPSRGNLFKRAKNSKEARLPPREPFKFFGSFCRTRKRHCKGQTHTLIQSVYRLSGTEFKPRTPGRLIFIHTQALAACNGGGTVSHRCVMLKSLNSPQKNLESRIDCDVKEQTIHPKVPGEKQRSRCPILLAMMRHR